MIFVFTKEEENLPRFLMTNLIISLSIVQEVNMRYFVIIFLLFLLILNLSAERNLVYNPTSIIFEAILIGTSSYPMDIIIINDSDQTLEITASELILTGNDPDQFIWDDLYLPVQLAPGQDVQIPVQFVPTTRGLKTAILRITDPGTEIDFDVPLTGHAISESSLYEGFEEATFPPQGWSIYNGGDDFTWIRDEYFARTGTGCAMLGFNLENAQDDWLITPRLFVSEDDRSFSFWAMKSDGNPYYFDIKLSIFGNDFADFTNILGSNVELTEDYVYTFYSFDLEAYIGEPIYLAIHKAGLESCDLYIDDIAGPELYLFNDVPDPPVLEYPENEATGLSITGFELTWLPASSGEPVTGYSFSMASSSDSLFTVDAWNAMIGNPETPSYNPFVGGFTYEFSATYFWAVQSYNDFGFSVSSEIRSFTIEEPLVTIFPYYEDFDGYFPPPGWENIKISGIGEPGTWDSVSYGTFPICYPFGYAMARYNCLFLEPDTRGALITRPLEIPIGETYRIRFYMFRDYYYPEADDRLHIYINDLPSLMDATELAVFSRYYQHEPAEINPNLWYEYTVDLPVQESRNPLYVILEGESQFGANIFLDEFFIEEVIVTPVPNLSYYPDSIDFGQHMLESLSEYINVVVSNVGEGLLELGVDDIFIDGYFADQFEIDYSNLPASLANNESVNIPVRYVPTIPGPVSAIMGIYYNFQVYNVALSGEAVLGWQVTIGSGTDISLHLPIYPYYENNYSQSIYLQSEIDLDGQNIVVLSYYWNGLGVAYDSNEWTVYMGHTSMTEFSSTDDWIPMSGMSQVYNGPVELQAAEGWVDLILDNPFPYNNIDNLVIAVLENVPGMAYGDLGFFCTETAMNRSIAFYTDEEIDPAGLPLGVGLIKAGFPNIMLGLNDDELIPVFQINPGMLDFGYIVLGTTKTLQVTLSNVGHGTLDIYSLTDMFPGTVFSILNDPTPVSLDHDQSVSFQVRYEPEYDNSHDETVINIEFSDDNYLLNISGYGIEAVIEFPWFEDFETMIFPPDRWRVVDLSGFDVSWTENGEINHTPDGMFSAYHESNYLELDDDWLVTPPLSIPLEYDWELNFWSYLVNIMDYDQSGVFISTTSPIPPSGFTELWTPSEINTGWSEIFVDLNPYRGQTIYLGFRYTGFGAHIWAVDDIKVYSVNIPTDDLPPEIIHLPVLNTLRSDIPYRVMAEIIDDPFYNSPIGSAKVIYSVNDGQFLEIEMINEYGDIYYADIPAQNPDSEITYFLWAEDIYYNNIMYGEYFFTVADPVWIRYDSGFITGLETSYTTFGAANYFENPYYGTDIPLQLLQVDGMIEIPTLVTLEIYSFNSWQHMELKHTEQVYMENITTIDLSAENITIFDQYFLIGFFGIPPGRSFGVNNMYDYGMSLIYLMGDTILPLEDKAWYIGAYLGTGATILPVPQVSINMIPGIGAELSWDFIEGANSYRVYGSDNPSDPDPWNLLIVTDDHNFVYTGSEQHYFFKVVASSEYPSRSTERLIERE